MKAWRGFSGKFTEQKSFCHRVLLRLQLLEERKAFKIWLDKARKRTQKLLKKREEEQRQALALVVTEMGHLHDEVEKQVQENDKIMFKMTT